MVDKTNYFLLVDHGDFIFNETFQMQEHYKNSIEAQQQLPRVSRIKVEGEKSFLSTQTLKSLPFFMPFLLPLTNPKQRCAEILIVRKKRYLVTVTVFAEPKLLWTGQQGLEFPILFVSNSCQESLKQLLLNQKDNISQH